MTVTVTATATRAMTLATLRTPETAASLPRRAMRRPASGGVVVASPVVRVAAPVAPRLRAARPDPAGLLGAMNASGAVHSGGAADGGGTVATDALGATDTRMSERTRVTACVAVGANLGDALEAVRQAVIDLGRLPCTQVELTSSLYRSAPYEAQGPDFINAIVRIATSLSAPDLLVALQALESAAGRERPYLNAPRTLDLDLIFYGQACMDSPALTLPHPRWQERAFVLLPLAEVAPDRVTPAMLAAVAGQAIERVG